MSGPAEPAQVAEPHAREPFSALEGTEADIHLDGRDQALRRDDRRRRPDALDRARRLLRDARPVGLRQDDDAADDRRLRGPDRGQRLPRRRRGHRQPPYKRDVNTVFQSYALFPHLTRREERRLRPRAQEGRQGRDRASASARSLELVQLGHARQAQARAALRRPAAARRARPRARQPPAGAAARRAARRARPAPAQAAADRAQADPAGRRHHLRARHARPGGGHDRWPTRSR